MTSTQPVIECSHGVAKILCVKGCAPHREDAVNHPKHYTFGGDAYEVIKVLEAWDLTSNFYLANVVKYVARANHKGTPLQDLKKARWYLDRQIQRMEKNV